MTTPEYSDLVGTALKQLRAHFHDHELKAEPDGNGGAYVQISDVFIGDQYDPKKSWFGFHVPNTYPFAMIYPHYLSNTVKRTDGKNFSGGFHQQVWDRAGQAIPTVMVSRRAKEHNAAAETAVTKAEKVLEWIREQ